jgi:hypothetical protein
MMRPETKAEIEATEQRLKELNEQARQERKAELDAQPLLERLVFAAYERCPCGAGMAYDPAVEKPPFRGPAEWECSAVLLGAAKPEHAGIHSPALPFAFYSIKSEGQPSANGATTRPPRTKSS